jgi:hypothetical protein
MGNEDYSGRYRDGSSNYRQRALVLRGGGALGVYEVGVLQVLCKWLYEEDNENNYLCILTKNKQVFRKRTQVSVLKF